MLRSKLLLSLSFALLISCGDESSNGPSNNENGGTEVPCIAANEGEIIKPVDSDNEHICKDGNWRDISSSSSSAIKISSSSSVIASEVRLSSSSSIVSNASKESSSSSESPIPISSENESSSSETNEESSSSKETKMYLCDNGITYVLDLENCGLESSSSEESSSSSETSIPVSSENQQSSSEIEESSSSKEKVEESSSSENVEECSSSVEQSSSSEAKIAEVKPNNYYQTNCPEGLTCEYVNTYFLNQNLLDDNRYGEILDERDGQVYKTTVIGEQTWLAQNLNYDTLDVSRCYGDSEENCHKYGRMYLVETAKNACPSGWRLPTRDEVNVLRSFIKNEHPDDSVAYHIKSKKDYAGTGWNGKWCTVGQDDDCISTNGVDTYGFSLSVGGMCSIRLYDHNAISCTNLHLTPYFWTSSKETTFSHRVYCSIIYLNDSQGYFYFDSHSSSAFMYVRCIKD